MILMMIYIYTLSLNFKLQCTHSAIRKNREIFKAMILRILVQLIWVFSSKILLQNNIKNEVFIKLQVIRNAWYHILLDKCRIEYEQHFNSIFKEKYLVSKSEPNNFQNSSQNSDQNDQKILKFLLTSLVGVYLISILILKHVRSNFTNFRNCS